MKKKYSRKKVYYVYVLLDPRKSGEFKYSSWKFNYEPFYVGKGHGDRAYAHTEDNLYDRNVHKKRKIASIRRKGLDHLVLIQKDKLTEKQAFLLETKLVSDIGRHNFGEGPLTNLTDGGDGVIGHKHSEETKEIIRQAGLGRKHSKETKEKLSDFAIERAKDPKYIKNISKPKCKSHSKNVAKAVSLQWKDPVAAAKRAANISKALKKYFANNRKTIGNSFPPEVCAKYSASRIRRNKERHMFNLASLNVFTSKNVIRP